MTAPASSAGGNAVETWRGVADVMARYRAAPARVRAYLHLRWRGFRQFGRVAELVPPGARVLDLGCGYGWFTLLLHLRRGVRVARGLDLSADRIAVAHASAAGDAARAGLVFARGDMRRLAGEADGSWDAVVCMDALCYLPRVEQDALLREAWRLLADGGRLILKDFERTPRTKYGLLLVHEALVNGFKRAVRGRAYGAFFDGALHVRFRADMLCALTAAGFRGAAIALHRGTWQPHVVYVGEKGDRS